MTEKILIANRGEIALRIVRACKQKGLKTVLAHSTADRHSLAVRFADESVCIGPAAGSESYSNISAIISAAQITKARYIHPGYGFLAEQARFAKALAENDLIFVGPKPSDIALMGDKGQARTYVEKMNIPCVPGTPSVNAETDLWPTLALAESIGFPVLIKAAGGGGGRGMKIVYDGTELLSQIRITQHEALKAFGDSHIYLEKFLEHPRHIEVQVLGSGTGKAIHIGLRDCSLQRRYQKIIEEAQPIDLPKDVEQQLLSDALKICEGLDYSGLGTLEFLYQDGKYYFIEMNTRVQVEHPISEMISQIDLIDAQISVALGEPWKWEQEHVILTGHSIECRINAEDPCTFAPCAGKISWLHAPGGFGVRFDSLAYSGCEISPFYDSLVAKVITHAPTREQAIRKMQQALEECVIEGIKTNLELHKRIFKEPNFIAGSYDTTYLKTKIFF
jgi:acetyl-CoA carboxylase biotin carboxylase subunit